jgi:3-dehydroquinate synthase
VSERIVHVDLGPDSYDVQVGAGLLGDVGARVRGVSSARKVALVSDATVARLLGATVGASLHSAGFEVLTFDVEAGERSKNWRIAGELLEAFAYHGLGRNDLVVALGGGVIGDLAGFAAATYLRGVDFVQVPTTLLAQVDSSVGGKTGVDLAAGKNLVGAFQQPKLVVADTSALMTLPESEWTSGCAEVAKTAVLDGEEFLSTLEASAASLMARDEAVTVDTVQRCVRFKSAVVRSDEKDRGARECLNYGHTLGHAIETVAGYGAFPHGLAVAEGMRFAARLSVEVAQGSVEFVQRQDRLLDSVGIPVMSQALAPGSLLRAMHADKKARDGQVRFVLVDAPGVWQCDPVPDATVMEHLQAWSASKGGGSG